MLLAIDVGNTQTVIGVFKGEELYCHWRISTNKEETADELTLTLSDLFGLKGFGLKDITAIIISSVVPRCTASLTEMVKKTLKIPPLIVDYQVPTGLKILYDNPAEIGADRIVNAAAAYGLYGGPIIVVDFGTATTFDLVTKKGEYLGGAIAPGIEISAEALFNVAAKLSRVELTKPSFIIGKNTQESLQSGIIFGFGGLVDTVVEKMKEEIASNTKVIATGGLASLMTPVCQSIDELNSDLTLIGLKKIYELNRP